jgi:3-methylfumaryl-CoA hydratase
VTQSNSFKDWLGRQQTEEDEVAVGAVRRLAAMLDQEPAAYHRGSEMPESWYALLFGPTAQQSQIGADGHPRTGDFLPPMAGTRRMFAGRRVKFHKPLKVGDTVQRVSTIAQAEPKTGRSGAFTLVTVVHEISAGQGVAITEEQDLVYRQAVSDPAAAAPAKAAAKQAEAAAQWSEGWTPDTVQLFRYSALTFNSHRIHYDLPYAREVEGYPALVINGGLTALMLVERARPHLPGRIAGYDARAMKPLFIGQTVTLNGRVGGNTAELWASDPSGARNYRLDVTLEGK